MARGRVTSNKKKDVLFVMTKAKDLAKYILTVTEKSPKKFRFTLVVRLQNYILDIIQLLYLANTSPLGEDRRRLQDDAAIKLNMLDYYSDISHDVQCITFHQYEQISMQVSECLLYLGKWVASDAKRVSAADG